MDATVQVENYQKIEASQFGDEAPALSRTIDQWNDGDTQRLLDSIRDLLFIRPDIAERKQAEAEAHFEEWGRSGYQEPDLTSEQKQSWDLAIYVQFSDHPGSHGVLLRIQDLIPYRLELHFLSLLHELKNEGDDMNTSENRHQEILAAIKAGLSGNLEQKVDDLAKAVGQNSPNKTERTGLYLAFSNVDAKLDTVLGHFRKAFWWGLGLSAGVGLIGWKLF